MPYSPLPNILSSPSSPIRTPPSPPSPSPLSPPPVAPLCFLNERRPTSCVAIFYFRNAFVAGSSETGRKTVGLCRFIDDAYRLLALPGRNEIERIERSIFAREEISLEKMKIIVARTDYSLTPSISRSFEESETRRKIDEREKRERKFDEKASQRQK